MHGLWVPGEPQLVSSPAGLLAHAGLGVLMAAPFVRAIGASLAGIEKVEEEPKCGEFRLRLRQIRKINPCLPRGLVVTHGNEPEGSPFTGTFIVALQGALHVQRLQKCPLSPPSSILAAEETAPMV